MRPAFFRYDRWRRPGTAGEAAKGQNQNAPDRRGIAIILRGIAGGFMRK